MKLFFSAARLALGLLSLPVLCHKAEAQSGPPVPTTQPPAAIGAASATLQGTVDPNGLRTAGWFQWGPSTNYSAATPAQLLGATNAPSTILQPITNLVPGQIYHYRAAATNSASLGVGLDQYFTPGFSNAFGPNNALGPNKGVERGSAAWGDFDGDGFLDLLVTGDDYTNGHAHICRYDGAVWSLLPDPGGNPATSSGLVGVRQGAGLWGDFDNDGALDVLLTGLTNAWYYDTGVPVTRIHRNTKGMFTNLLAEFTGLWRSCAAAADYNNDGFLDFVVSGITTTNRYDPPAGQTIILYRNNGDGTFTAVPTGLPAVYDGAMAWGDFDNDGQLDLAIMGNTGESNITRIYRNDHGVFTDIGANLPGVCCGSLAWGDYDNDGQLDLLVAGTQTGGYDGICRIYRNDHGTFTDIGAGLPGSSYGIAAWGDFDGDGYLDILFTHGLNPTYSTRIYRNDYGVFTDIQAGLDAFQYSTGAWGDYDGDGRLDLAVSGYYGIEVYRSFVSPPATNPFAPFAPSGLASTVQTNSVALTWLPGSNAHTPTAGLTYNLRVGLSSGGVQIVSPASDPVTGRRRVPQMGNAEHRLFAALKNLPVGLYYWSVQTVNNSFAGSPWAPEQTFAVTSGPPVVVTLPANNVLGNSALFSGTVIPGGQAAHAWFDFGTTTNFGSATSALDVGTGVSPQFVSTLVTNLQPRFTYFFRFAASNSAGLAAGTNRSFTTLGPPPATVTAGASNVAYTFASLLGACPRSSPPADYFIEWGLTTNYGNLVAATAGVPALRFDGVDDLAAVGWGKFPQITNNFTMELWANPTGGRAETPETTGGGWGVGGQRYAIFPDHGKTAYTNGVQTGAGVSIGANGVSVMEHTDNYMPSVLVYTGSLSGWTHVAIVYSNHVPSLYINGTLMRTGLTGLFPVHPSADMGGTTNLNYGQFEGALQEVRIWDLPLDETTIQTWMNRTLTTNHPAYSRLQGYWPLNEGQGTMVADLSVRGNSGHLLNGPSWDAAGWMANAQTFSANLTGLAPGTTYHFRAVATNSGGAAYGADQTFTTFTRPQVLNLSAQPGPSYALSFTGMPGLGFVVEASTNLVYWTVLSNLQAAPDGLFGYLDVGATNLPTRFYRLRVP